MSIRAGVIISITFHQVDHAPHRKASAKGNNESLQNGDCLSNKSHKILLKIRDVVSWLLKMGKKIEAPSWFRFIARYKTGLHSASISPMS